MQFHLFIIYPCKCHILIDDIPLFSIIDHFDLYIKDTVIPSKKFLRQRKVFRFCSSITGEYDVHLRSWKLQLFAPIHILFCALKIFLISLGKI